jgi:hypothetical protein
MILMSHLWSPNGNYGEWEMSDGVTFRIDHTVKKGDVCEYCRNAFEKSRGDQRFCSNACRRASIAKKESTKDKYRRKQSK